MMIITYPLSCISFDSYIKPQLYVFFVCAEKVVYLSIPTSNHNHRLFHGFSVELYIFRFLHQTTTCLQGFEHKDCCISFDSYIKPQPNSQKIIYETVVYLSIPTSNHNFNKEMAEYQKLYIFRFLHQTTTFRKTNQKHS